MGKGQVKRNANAISISMQVMNSWEAMMTRAGRTLIGLRPEV